MTVTSNIKLKPLIINIAIPLAVGGVSALITGSGFKEYSEINQPMLSPPPWVFPVVWTILYILMGIASYLVWEKDNTEAKRPLAVYAIQLFFNFLWPIFFFSLHAYLFSFIWIMLLWALVVATTLMFYRVNKTAGLLMIPYLVWLTFAAYLNLGVYILN